MLLVLSASVLSCAGNPESNGAEGAGSGTLEGDGVLDGPGGGPTDVIGPEDESKLNGGEGVQFSTKTEDEASAGARPYSEEELDEYQSLVDRAAELENRKLYDRAKKLIDQAMTLSPPQPFYQRLREIEMRVKSMLLKETYLNIFVVFSKPHYSLGEIIEGDLVVMNVSNDTLRIPAMGLAKTEEGLNRSATIFRTEVVYREFLPNNTLVSNRDIRNVQLAKDIVLARGEVYKLPIAISTDRVNPQGVMLRRFTMSCKLHCSAIEIGGEEYHGVLEFAPRSVSVFPRNAEHLADNPLERVYEALEKESAIHLTLAAAFVKEAQQEDLFLLCEKTLKQSETSDAMSLAVQSSLSIVLNAFKTKNKDQWIQWLKTRKTNP